MLAFDVTLRFGVYDAAASADPRKPEWPPEPARLFCALIAGDPDEQEWAALRWLERLRPPEIHCADPISVIDHQQFVITNEAKAGSPLRPGRSAKARIKSAVAPAAGAFSFEWPEAVVPHDVLISLRRLARRVPYLGRSTSQVTVDVRTTPRTPAPVVYELGSIGDVETELGVPHAGLTDALRGAYEDGRRAWEVRGAPMPYRRRREQLTSPEAPKVFGPLSNLLMLDCELPQAFIQHTVRIVEALREAVMSRVADPLPPALSGHGAGGAGHIGFLALPDVGAPRHLPSDDRIVRWPNPHGSGRLLTLALSIPVDLEAHDVRKVLAAFDAPWELELPSGMRAGPRRVEVRRQVGPPPATGASRQRWSRDSTVWATATPVVFDRYPAGRSEEQMIRDALVGAGYPTPVRVVAQRAPILSGAVTHARSSVLRRAGATTKPYCHAWVEFDRPVEGPVLAGSMRYRGLGLFAPVRVDKRPAAATVAAGSSS